MRDAERKVQQAARDACGDDGYRDYDNMVWDGDMLVPRESSLDMETLDERTAKGMGPNWEERRRE